MLNNVSLPLLSYDFYMSLYSFLKKKVDQNDELATRFFFWMDILENEYKTRTRKINGRKLWTQLAIIIIQ